MSQWIETPRYRIANFAIGTGLAVMQAEYLINFAGNYWQVEKAAIMPLIEACLRAGWIAGCLALTVTILTLVLARCFKRLTSVAMILIGNFLVPMVFSEIFRHLFFKALNSVSTNSNQIIDTKLLFAEMALANGVSSGIGIYAGIGVSWLAYLVLGPTRRQKADSTNAHTESKSF
jgi:hypothetical protein